METGAARSRILKVVVAILAMAMIVFHMANIHALFLSHYELLALHLSFALSIVFLQRAERNPRGWLFFVLIFFVAVLLTGYIFFSADALMDREQAPTRLDTVVGAFLIAVTLLACYLSYGWSLVIVALAGLAFAFLGPYLPGPLFHGGIDFTRLVAMVTTDFDGIFGLLLYVSAAFMVIYLALAGFIGTTGAVEAFVNLAFWVTRGAKAGGAYSSVISSSIIGMMEGSSVANVATDGVFNIPMMKRSGLPPHVASAVEASTSSGGQIMPPVMGAAAFVMAEWIGMPYIKICAYAAIPAFIYYAAMAFSVRFSTEPLDLRRIPKEELPSFRKVLRGFRFFIPILVLLGVMLAGRTPAMAGFWAIISLIVLSVPRRPGKEFVGKILEGLEKGGRMAAEFAVGMACIGIFVKVLIGTGVALKLPMMVAQYAGGNLLLAYVLTAVVSIIMGMGMPTIAAYIVCAVIAAPALVHMGTTPLQAHFFCFYFAVFSGLTPPVAVVAMVAAKIGEANFFRTCWSAIRFSLVAFLMPFIFVFDPALMGIGSLGNVLADTLLTLLAAMTASACLWRYFLRRTTILDLFLLGLSSLGFFTYLIGDLVPFLGIGLGCFIAVALKQGFWGILRRGIARVGMGGTG